MNPVTAELMHQILRRLQDRQADTKAQLDEIREELRALRGHTRAIQTDVSNLYAAQAALAARVEQVESGADLNGAGRQP